MNQEVELSDILTTHLTQKFQIFDWQNLLLYLNLRYDCLNKYEKEKSAEQFMRFILRELYVIPENTGLVWNQKLFTFAFSSENSLANIFDDWQFTLYQHQFIDKNGKPLKVDEYEKNIYDKITQKAKRLFKKYKNSKYENEILKHFKLICLNKHFDVCISDVADISGLEQLEIHLSIEEQLERYVQAAEFNTINVKLISENNLRDYLYYHLNLIEDGLTPIGKEIPANEGRIDVLARDKNGNIVVLELKTEIDKRLVWQCLYYPMVVKKQYQTQDKIRLITICPQYPDYLFDVLKQIPDVEMIQYEIISTNQQIQDIRFVKFA